MLLGCALTNQRSMCVVVAASSWLMCALGLEWCCAVQSSCISGWVSCTCFFPGPDLHTEIFDIACVGVGNSHAHILLL